MIFEVIKGKAKRGLSEDAVVDVLFRMRSTCALDVADDGGGTFEELGAVLCISRERVRQIEEGGIGVVHRKQGGMVAVLRDFRCRDVRPGRTLGGGCWPGPEDFVEDDDPCWGGGV